MKRQEAIEYRDIGAGKALVMLISRRLRTAERENRADGSSRHEISNQRFVDPLPPA
jgi:hypothetical protein